MNEKQPEEYLQKEQARLPEDLEADSGESFGTIS